MPRFGHRRFVLLRAALALALCAPGEALARDYAAAPLEPGATLSLWSSQVHSPGRYALALGLQARSIAVPAAAEEDGGERAGSASTLELMGTVGVWQRLDLSAAIALERIQLGETGSTAAERRSALGDVRLVPRLRLLGGDPGSGLALLLPVSRPGGLSESSDSAFDIEPRLAASFASGRVTALANAGYRVTTGAADLRSTVPFGVGAEVFVAKSWAVLSEVLGSWSARAGEERRLSSEARLGARYASSGWAAQFGVGRGLLGGAGEPDLRLLASVSFSPAGSEPTVTAAPIQVAAVGDVELDYLRSEADWRPLQEEAGADPETAPATPEPAERRAAGTPAPETAVTPEDAEADLSTVQIPEMEIQAEEGGGAEGLPRITLVIRFAKNQMRLDREQLALLDDVAQQMLAAPRARLIVEGHSDSSGPPGFNWRLSRMRASTVRYHLIRRGIAWQRISLRAYGSSRPEAASATKPDPAQDRRVEFRVLRRSW